MEARTAATAARVRSGDRGWRRLQSAALGPSTVLCEGCFGLGACSYCQPLSQATAQMRVLTNHVRPAAAIGCCSCQCPCVACRPDVCVGLRVQDRHLPEGGQLHKGGGQVQRRRRLLPRHALQEWGVHGADLLEEVQRLPLLQRTQEGLRSRAGGCSVGLSGPDMPVRAHCGV